MPDEHYPGRLNRNYFADPQEWVNLFKVAGDHGKADGAYAFRLI
jgi:hypothetical protein